MHVCVCAQAAAEWGTWAAYGPLCPTQRRGVTPQKECLCLGCSQFNFPIVGSSKGGRNGGGFGLIR